MSWHPKTHVLRRCRTQRELAFGRGSLAYLNAARTRLRSRLPHVRLAPRVENVVAMPPIEPRSRESRTSRAERLASRSSASMRSSQPKPAPRPVARPKHSRRSVVFPTAFPPTMTTRSLSSTSSPDSNRSLRIRIGRSLSAFSPHVKTVEDLFACQHAPEGTDSTAGTASALPPTLASCRLLPRRRARRRRRGPECDGVHVFGSWCGGIDLLARRVQREQV